MERAKTSEVLRHAMILIAHPADWCQRDYAQNLEGEQVASSAQDACRFCAEGAVLRAHMSFRAFAYPSTYLARAVADKYGPDHYRGVVNFNDDPATTHGMVLAIFTRAIEMAEAGGD